MSDNRDIERQTSTESIQSLVVGNQVFVIGQRAGGQHWVFSRDQMEFLIQLQKLKNVAAAAMSIKKTEEWADKFLRSKKFRSYLMAKMEEFSAKAGMNVEWWYQFGKWVTDGKRESYAARCPGCELEWEVSCYEADASRNDEMETEMGCPACMFKPVSLLKKEVPFTATREQMQAWSEIGSRLLPKVERVQHQFEKAEFVFESGGGE